MSAKNVSQNVDNSMTQASGEGQQMYQQNAAAYQQSAAAYQQSSAAYQQSAAAYQQSSVSYVSQKEVYSGMVPQGSQSISGQQQMMAVSYPTQYVAQGSIAGGSSVGRYKSETRVVGKEYGEERVISVTQRVDESRTQIVGERYVEHEVRVPKKIVREEIIEKVIIVPEKVIQEEIIDDYAKVQEKIIEVARPIIVEKVVEVPEYEYVEKIVEVPEKIVQERLKHVEKVEYKDRIQEVVKIIPQERIVEVPEVQYREVPVERVVEVPEWRDELVIKEVPVPQYVEKPVPNVIQVEQAVDVERHIPVPVEANITYEFRIPKIKPRYHKITYPVYLPRFIEVPVALELLQGGMLQQSEMYLQQIGSLTKAAASLCEIENLATTIMKADMQSKVSTMDLQSMIMKSWKEGTLNVQGMSSSMMMGASSATSYKYAASSTKSQQQQLRVM